MDLRWSGDYFRFEDLQGNLVAYDPSVEQVGPGVLLVAKERFEQFLAENNVDLIWTVSGERDLRWSWWLHNTEKRYGRLRFNGVYQLEHGIITGEMGTLFQNP